VTQGKSRFFPIRQVRVFDGGIGAVEALHGLREQSINFLSAPPRQRGDGRLKQVAPGLVFRMRVARPIIGQIHSIEQPDGFVEVATLLVDAVHDRLDVDLNFFGPIETGNLEFLAEARVDAACEGADVLANFGSPVLEFVAQDVRELIVVLCEVKESRVHDDHLCAVLVADESGVHALRAGRSQERCGCRFLSST